MLADASAEKSTTVRSNAPAVPAEIRTARTALRWLSVASPDLAAAVAERMFRTPRRFPRPADEHDRLAQARKFLVPHGDRALAAWEWGEAGPRVLLVHGWEGRGAQLGAWIEPLTTLGYRVVAFDAPAHGDSPGTATTFFEFADAIAHVAEAVGSLHAIVAHSMGGAATAWAARSRPLAKKYVMIAPPSDLRDFTRDFARAFGLDDAVRTRMEGRLERLVGHRLADASVEGLAASARGPLLVVHDLGDREVPFERGRAIARAWPDAVLHRTDGLGHRRILRDPEVVRLVERFVAYGATR
jgi:pimeloyl-ACP methyl ester carboxylesterase